MNHIMIIGNLCADPELRTTTTGKQVCNFRVAVNKRGSRNRDQQQDQQQGQQDADFFSVSVWNALAENCNRYLKKGRKVCVVGSVGIRTYTAKDGTTHASMEITGNEVEFLTAPSAVQEQGPSGQAPSAGYVEVSDGELPF